MKDSIDASEFGKSLKGVSFNILVENIERTTLFLQKVIKGTIIYRDHDILIASKNDHTWMYHADHTYKNHSLYGFVRNQRNEAIKGRGAGIEMHIYNTDPDDFVQSARKNEYIVLEEAMDKPHGLREAYVLDDDGYCWVASIPLQ